MYQTLPFVECQHHITTLHRRQAHEPSEIMK